MQFAPDAVNRSVKIAMLPHGGYRKTGINYRILLRAENQPVQHRGGMLHPNHIVRYRMRFVQAARQQVAHRDFRRAPGQYLPQPQPKIRLLLRIPPLQCRPNVQHIIHQRDDAVRPPAPYRRQVNQRKLPPADIVSKMRRNQAVPRRCGLQPLGNGLPRPPPGLQLVSRPVRRQNARQLIALLRQSRLNTGHHQIPPINPNIPRQFAMSSQLPNQIVNNRILANAGSPGQ